MQSNTQIIEPLVVISIVMLLFGIGLIFLATFYQNRVFKMRQEEDRNMLKVALESEKKERKRIAADLHDSVSGDLSAIRNFLSVVQKAEKDADKIALYKDISRGVEAALENTRLVSYKLMPPLLDSFGFRAATQDYFNRITAKAEIDFEFLCLEEPTFSKDTAYELLRIVQEFSSNAMKYGNARKFVFSVQRLGDRYHASIADDGDRFSFFEIQKSSKGSGLGNISSRIRSLDAVLEQEGGPGNRFIIKLPANA